MKIGIALDSLVPGRGGVEQWTWQLIAHLLPLGYEVHVVAFQVEASAIAEWQKTGRFGVHCPASPGSRLARAACVQSELERLNLDVIHDMGVGWYCDVFQPHGGSRRASFEQNVRLLPVWQRPLKRRLARLLPRYREFDRLAQRQYAGRHRVLALSQMVRAHLQRWHGVASERLDVVYNGVDCERFSSVHRESEGRRLRRALSVGDDETLYLLVAHNFRLKGVPAAVEAMSLLAQSDRFHGRLVVVGGRRISRFRRWIHRSGLAPYVHLVGPVDDTSRYYAAADVYVHPTFYDPCSLVVLEALASGIPVITTEWNGAGELITAGREGFVLRDPRDLSGLTAAMQTLTSAELRRSMGDAARQLARQHTFERNVAELVAIYEQVAGSPDLRLRAA